MADAGTSTETGTGPAADALTSTDAAGLFETMIDDDGELGTAADRGTGKPKAEKKPAEPASQDDEDDDEDDEGAEEGETPDEETADDEDADEDVEDETEDEDEPENEPDEEATVTVKVDGKTEKLTLAELKKGYSRTKVFTQRTQEAAEVRKQAEADRAAIAAERQQLADAAKELDELRAAVNDEPDWEALRAADPMEYTYQRELWREKQEERAKLQGVQRELQRRNAEDQQKALAAHVEGERAKLIEKIPEWADQKKAAKDLGEIKAYATDIGFSEAEIDQIYDHRAVLAIRDAMRYRKLMARKADLREKEEAGEAAASTKKAVRTAKPGRSREKPGRAAARREAIDRVRQTGRTDDAMAAFKTIPGLLD